MAKHDDFASQKLNALKEPENFQPSTARGRIQLQLRRGARSRQLAWKLAFAAVPAVLFLALPAARAVAQTGTLSPDAYLHSLHDSLLGFHEFVYRLWQHF